MIFASTLPQHLVVIIHIALVLFCSTCVWLIFSTYEQKKQMRESSERQMEMIAMLGKICDRCKKNHGEIQEFINNIENKDE
ncbi:MAG: hypothetical protein FWD31_03765 [Planctomycetaceae bacterium]|nr:hypothetical protein [Planctomycetaceae bacterium]